MTTIQREELASLSRADVLGLDAKSRYDWFSDLIVNHREFARASSQLEELLTMRGDSSNIIGLVGMTGAGKSLLAESLMQGAENMFPRECTSQISILAVEAPASGERAWSLKPLFKRVLMAAEEPLVGRQRPMQIADGHLRPVRMTARLNVDEFRICVERLLENRLVKVLLVDESLHFLRFNKNDAVMDALKSLSNMTGTKILLVGPHGIATMLYDYDQTSRRSDIVHLRRYLWTRKSDRGAFMNAVKLFMDNWPCATVPPVVEANFCLTQACAGGMGVAKQSLTRLLEFQLKADKEQIDLDSLWRKVLRPPAARQKIEAAAVAGEALTVGKCYDDENVDWFGSEGHRAVI